MFDTWLAHKLAIYPLMWRMQAKSQPNFNICDELWFLSEQTLDILACLGMVWKRHTS